MKSKLILLIKFIIFTGLFCIISRGSINGMIFPFAFPILFALAWAGQKVWILAPAYIIGGVVSDYSFAGIISTLVAVIFLVVPYYIHICIKKPMPKWELFILAFLSQTARVVFSFLGNRVIYLTVIEPVIGLIYLYLALSVIEPLLTRGLAYKLSLAEMVSAGGLLLGFASGLSSINIYGFSLFKLVTALSILAINYVSTPGKTMLLSSVMGLGALLEGNNPLYMAPVIIWTLAVVAFHGLHRIFPAISIVLGELLVTFYFNLYYSFTVQALMTIIVASLIYLLIPEKYYKQLSILLSTRGEKSAVKSLLNRNRDIMQRRLNKLSEVFFDMNMVFRTLIKKEASIDEAKEMLYEEIKSSICKNCPEQKHCHRTFSEDTRKIFINLITIALERGKITLLDLPSYLSSRCSSSGRLISEINTLTKQYKSYSELVGNIDTSKLLISDQLEGISSLMKTLAGEVDTMISMDSAREGKLIDALSSNNIICSDALVYEKDARTTMATLVVRDSDVNKLKLQGITSKICNQKMAIYDVTPTEKAGMMSVNLKTAPRFDCVFGLASTPKGGNNVSGDRHSIERLDGDRFIFAICDGMGNGEKAGEKAETAIGLIENFYKAGFESEIILSSVNKLMNLERDEIFSTIDICVIDLKDGIADFIKMGASSSYIRGEEGCEIIESSSLPMGILDNAKAHTKKVVLKEKDYIIICSDGINDAFGSDSEFKDFLLTIKGSNPQEFADKILENATMKNSGYAVDDMTVIVVKIF